MSVVDAWLPAVLAALAAAGGVLLVAGRRSRGLRARVAALEAERDSQRAASESLNRLASAGRVASGLAHEVGNPLCAITNYAHSLETRVAPELRPTLESLQREVSRIQRMTDSLIDFARPRDPGAPGADLNLSLRESLRFLGDQGVFRRITLVEKLDAGELPVASTAIELEQAFANLILNAAEAMPAGGRLELCTRRLPPTTIVDGAARRSGDDDAPLSRRPDDRVERWLAANGSVPVVKVVVADSGHGVTRGHEERIFEPFVSTRSPEQGTGLGLSIVRGIVSRMGGMVWVQPSREGGAAFHLVLPLLSPAGEPAR